VVVDAFVLFLIWRVRDAGLDLDLLTDCELASKSAIFS
jgi:hypothetical protein